MDWEKIKILHAGRNDRKRSIAEMMEIEKRKINSLNKMIDLKFFPPAYELIVHKN